MKIIGSVKEDLSIEKRISITPEIVRKFIQLGFSINLEKNYAEHLVISDKDYQNSGASISITKKEVFEKSDIILKVNCPSADEVNLIKNESILIGQFDININQDIIIKLKKKKLKFLPLICCRE
jgi:NAD(P) transhydrogenase subunit alpha